MLPQRPLSCDHYIEKIAAWVAVLVASAAIRVPIAPIRTRRVRVSVPIAAIGIPISAR